MFPNKADLLESARAGIEATSRRLYNVSEATNVIRSRLMAEHGDFSLPQETPETTTAVSNQAVNTEAIASTAITSTANYEMNVQSAEERHLAEARRSVAEAQGHIQGQDYGIPA